MTRERVSVVVPSRNRWALVRRTLAEFGLRDVWDDHYGRKADSAHLRTPTDFYVGNSSLQRSSILQHGGFAEEFRFRNEGQELGIPLQCARFDRVEELVARNAVPALIARVPSDRFFVLARTTASPKR